MSKNRLKTLIISLVVFGSCQLSWAEEYQTHDEIYAVVERYIDNELQDQDAQISVRRLDTRLRLKHCSGPLDVFWAPGARHVGATSVGVSCNTEKPWKIYVRVDIAVTRSVLVAARTLRRGDLLAETDLTFEKRDTSRLGDQYLENAAQYIGYEVVQTINAGRTLSDRMLRPPKWVKRGQKVTLIAEGAGLEVKMMGEALSDGARGAVIRVRNSSSKKIVQGEVVEKGVVKVLM